MQRIETLGDREERGVERLVERTKRYLHSDKYVAMLEWAGTARNLSPFNAMMINLQCPQAQWVDTVQGWNERGRIVREDARPILILVTPGPIREVYDITETVGTDRRTIVEVLDDIDKTREKDQENEEARNRVLKRLDLPSTHISA